VALNTKNQSCKRRFLNKNVFVFINCDLITMRFGTFWNENGLAVSLKQNILERSHVELCS